MCTFYAEFSQPCETRKQEYRQTERSYMDRLVTHCHSHVATALCSQTLYCIGLLWHLPTADPSQISTYSSQMCHLLHAESRHPLWPAASSASRRYQTHTSEVSCISCHSPLPEIHFVLCFFPLDSLNTHKSQIKVYVALSAVCGKIIWSARKVPK